MQQLITPTPTPKHPDAQPYLAELIACDGKIKLAAENLSITPAQLIMEIARDPEAQKQMDQYLRLYATFKAFQMLGESQMQLHSTIHELEGNQAAKHFTTLLTVIENFTKRTPASSNNTVNLFESALKHLPPEVSDALRILQQDSVITDDDYTSLVSNGQLLKDDE
jgi:hypothetical protein